MTITERLKNWIKTLNKEQSDNIILQLVEFAIDAQEVGFYNDDEKPYWSNTGDNLDGTEY